MSDENTDKQIEINSEKLENLEIDSKEKEIQPKIVKYCDLCRFPLEYCEYTHNIFAKGINKLENKEVKSEEKKIDEKEKDNKNEKTEDEEKKEKEKKSKKEKKKVIEIKVSKRGKKKHATQVFNLEEFNLNMKDVAKLFSKKFACSSTVSKEGDKDCIVLTGEFTYEIVDFLKEKFPNIVTDESCKISESN
jgi:density-regulated protein DRP1